MEKCLNYLKKSLTLNPKFKILQRNTAIKDL